MRLLYGGRRYPSSLFYAVEIYCRYLTLSHRGAIPPVLRTSLTLPTSHTYCIEIPTDERSDRDALGLSAFTHAGLFAVAECGGGAVGRPGWISHI